MTRLPVALSVVSCLAGGLVAAAPAWAQVSLAGALARSMPQGAAVGQLAAGVSQGDLRGTVLDESGKPLAGAVVSAVGATSVFAVSGEDGSFVLKNLPAGPYLLRAHLQGYVPVRGRLVEVNAPSRMLAAISLTRRGSDTEPAREPQVLEAGVGSLAEPTSGEAPAPAEGDAHDHSEVAWRLRHAKRSILKEAEAALPYAGDGLDGGPMDGLGRAVGSSARFASALFADLSLDGQINLLTRTSFDRPMDLLSLDGAPSGITYLALSAPTVGGEWSMRGAMTQGDLSSWILSGAYRRNPGAHQYEAGLSYGTQRYVGGNADALAAVSGGSRNVGEVFAYDNWTLSRQVEVTYGGKYARYDYLTERGLLSPSAAVTLTPVAGSNFRIQAAVSRREVAPGADEFLPPSTGLWLPPERTFSPVTPGAGFAHERVDRVEGGVEGEWIGDVVIGVRAFREQVGNQIVTLFGVELPGTAAANIGHYYVGSGGDFSATGFTFGVRRDISSRLRASVDYTQAEADWTGPAPDGLRLLAAAASALRTGSERLHDVTATIESEVPSTATRVVVLYKV
ncbi:MAG: TonB-dependent receptor, partial [Vicinamibacterales bacterium]